MARDASEPTRGRYRRRERSCDFSSPDSDVTVELLAEDLPAPLTRPSHGCRLTGPGWLRCLRPGHQRLPGADLELPLKRRATPTDFRVPVNLVTLSEERAKRNARIPGGSAQSRHVELAVALGPVPRRVSESDRDVLIAAVGASRVREPGPEDHHGWRGGKAARCDRPRPHGEPCGSRPRLLRAQDCDWDFSVNPMPVMLVYEPLGGGQPARPACEQHALALQTGEAGAANSVACARIRGVARALADRGGVLAARMGQV